MREKNEKEGATRHNHRSSPLPPPRASPVYEPYSRSPNSDRKRDRRRSGSAEKMNKTKFERRRGTDNSSSSSSSSDESTSEKKDKRRRRSKDDRIRHFDSRKPEKYSDRPSYKSHYDQQYRQSR